MPPIVEKTEQQKALMQQSLTEMVKLIFHADTSSGAAGGVIHGCINEIDKLCNAVQEAKQQHFFDTIIKTAKNKTFKDWPEQGYRLLKSAY